MSDNTLNPNNTFKTAGFWRRVAAFLIDTFGVYVVLIFLMIPVRNAFPSVMSTIATLSVVLHVMYFLFKDAHYPLRSIGKRLLRIQTVVESEGGIKPCGFGRSLLRNFVVFPLFPPAWGLEFLVMAFRKDKRRIGDFLANTRVVLVPPHVP